MAADIDKPEKTARLNVLVVVDTAYVKSTYGPNGHTTEPHAIGSEGQFMICPGARAVHARGAHELRLKAGIGDRVAVRVTSICANAGDAVIAYGFTHASGTKAFGHFEQVVQVRAGAVRPDPDSPYRNGLPPIESAADFTSFDSIVVRRGIERLRLAFALYVVSSNGQAQRPFGYYAWNPTISIE
ncbi:DNA-directed RNA polymerase subunit beta [Trinickia dabaoshanensis]|uniref:DNA-directed RNA polymerase subunit beta n=1 Tax=Trinickia dabaoshanensis TaxID=564714 RepID=A0A2N7VGS0_9BURK|nr:AidA/PixA family protein [Trinickia dabaoshanensis]PMS16345.1 DNA-directed RNA polymerase subunit beta [Trinickia dabaoshanensis]